MPKNETVKIVPRPVPLVPNRVASVFKQKQSAVVAEANEDDGETRVIEKLREVRKYPIKLIMSFLLL